MHLMELKFIFIQLSILICTFTKCYTFSDCGTKYVSNNAFSYISKQTETQQSDCLCVHTNFRALIGEISMPLKAAKSFKYLLRQFERKQNKDIKPFEAGYTKSGIMGKGYCVRYADTIGPIDSDWLSRERKPNTINMIIKDKRYYIDDSDYSANLIKTLSESFKSALFDVQSGKSKRLLVITEKKFKDAGPGCYRTGGSENIRLDASTTLTEFVSENTDLSETFDIGSRMNIDTASVKADIHDSFNRVKSKKDTKSINNVQTVTDTVTVQIEKCDNNIGNGSVERRGKKIYVLKGFDFVVTNSITAKFVSINYLGNFELFGKDDKFDCCEILKFDNNTEVCNNIKCNLRQLSDAIKN